MVQVGDRYVLHSNNGMDYSIIIVNINHYREPSAIYGASICDENGVYAKDIVFFDDDFLSKCEKANIGLE